MIDKRSFHGRTAPNGAEEACWDIYSLCKVGVAAADTCSKPKDLLLAFETLFETIADLAETAVHLMDEADQPGDSKLENSTT